MRPRVKQSFLVSNTEEGRRRYEMHGDSDGHHSSEDEFAALLEAELGEDDPGSQAMFDIRRCEHRIALVSSHKHLKKYSRTRTECWDTQRSTS